MIRVGHGYDVHKFAEGRALILGGVSIPHEKGLLGHSDADVLTHALMDALLGAAGLGDIGRRFPDSDDRWKGADSVVMLKMVAEMLSERGWHVENADMTIIAQRPKLAPYIGKMVKTLSDALGTGSINIKATTEEGMGFTGRGEGIAAHAVCLICSGEK